MLELILGGARSGKSRLAEQRALASGLAVTYENVEVLEIDGLTLTPPLRALARIIEELPGRVVDRCLVVTLIHHDQASVPIHLWCVRV